MMPDLKHMEGPVLAKYHTNQGACCASMRRYRKIVKEYGFIINNYKRK